MKVTRRDVVGGAGVLAFQAIAGSARAETDMSSVPFAATAPTHVSKVGIKAKDADQLSKYYSEVVGLRELSRKGQTIVLGTGEVPLLEIEQAAAIRADDPRSAGLYHTAFLLPRRVDRSLRLATTMDGNVNGSRG